MQLSVRCKSIYEELIQRMRMDTVFLEFPDAFDKLNYRILLHKVVKQNVKGKLGRRIKIILKNRRN